MKSLNKELLMSGLSLFGSIGTLLCCALPALLVSIGAGAVLAGLVSNVPQLIWLSERKIPLFGASAALLLIAGCLLWRQRKAPCPTDPIQARACKYFRRISLWLYFTALILYAVGFFFAFLAASIL